MNRFLWVLLSLFPTALAWADEGSISLKPPPSDASVVFLGNIFGVVDGVLHGTGSQIMGSMFAVFNSAVLALGGIIVMYTLLVSTMNTAHEGQFLGQKWSSLWIPMRTTFGLALLIPKASGYCMMQIFVMWVIVQGVGAADKVWDAALGYLNRGGVIIQQKTNLGSELVKPAGSDIASGAVAILTGQVCMLGLQRALEDQKKSYMQQKQEKSGPCYGSLDSTMTTICNNEVPNFINSVNVIDVAENQTPMGGRSDGAKYHSVDMPNFAPTSPYASLNGVCGTVKWNAMELDPTQKKLFDDITNTDSSAIDLTKKSRSMAVQQMYLDLSIVAQAMVNNMPNTSNNSSNEPSPYSAVAQNPFGEPLAPNNSTGCVPEQTCVSWGMGSSSSGTPLFNGTELQGAVQDYNSVMSPTLNLFNQVHSMSSNQASREFIGSASRDGWLLAGSYFFYIVNLNTASYSPGLVDKSSGVSFSTVTYNNLRHAFGASGSCSQSNQYSDLCYWLGGNKTPMVDIINLIEGGQPDNINISGVNSPPQVSKPEAETNGGILSSTKVQSGLASSTVFGYANNALAMRLPGQPGLSTPNFGDMFDPRQSWSTYSFPEMPFSCGEVKFLFFVTCLAQMFGELLYDGLIVPVFNMLVMFVTPVINNLLIAILMAPLQGMALIFNQGIELIANVGRNNPIVLLAQMGTNYINFAWNLFLSVAELAVVGSLIPGVGVVVMFMVLLVLPLFATWLSTMVTIGFSTAYYVPLVPYMIFTFGSIAWFIAVIEAMVAAPIVAVGVTHPEGHEAFGKGEAAIMILMNVFLRPSMMIIGYIASIILTYVGVWVLNAGFDNAIGFIQGSTFFGTTGGNVHGASNIGGYGEAGVGAGMAAMDADTAGATGVITALATAGYAGFGIKQSSAITGAYKGMAGIFAYFFAILSYTVIYIAIVQKSFTLISVLPDRVLRWIGGQPESAGQESAQWGDEAKQKIQSAGDETFKASGAVQKQITGKAEQAISKAKGGGGGGQSQAGPKGGGGDAGGAGGGAPE